MPRAHTCGCITSEGCITYGDGTGTCFTERRQRRRYGTGRGAWHSAEEKPGCMRFQARTGGTIIIHLCSIIEGTQPINLQRNKGNLITPPLRKPFRAWQKYDADRAIMQLEEEEEEEQTAKDKVKY